MVGKNGKRKTSAQSVWAVGTLRAASEKTNTEKRSDTAVSEKHQPYTMRTLQQRPYKIEQKRKQITQNTNPINNYNYASNY